MMGLSIAFLALSLGSSRPERVTRWVYLVSSALMVAAFVGMSWYFGFDLEYRFEVTAISIAWLTLMISGSLLAFVFRRPTHRRQRGERIPSQRINLTRADHSHHYRF